MACVGVEDSRHLLKQLSHQSSSESCVGEELDLLSNVYFDDLQVSRSDRGYSLSLHVTPSTADDKEKQYVYLDLAILLIPEYPHTVPEVRLGQSRGLSDAHLRGISEGLALKSEELVGSPMIYELVEYARECLTDNNLPCSHCAVCQEGDEFTKTDCYHYLHVACFARYVDFSDRERREMEKEEAMVDTMLRKKPKQLECPVCRDPILPGSACLEAISRVKPEVLRYDDNVHFIPSAKLRAWQERMKVLLWQQKQKGGVIDPNSEDDVIDETWVSSVRKKGQSEVEGESKTKVSEKSISDDECSNQASSDMAEGDGSKSKPVSDDVSKITTELQRSKGGYTIIKRECCNQIYDQGRVDIGRYSNTGEKAAKAQKDGGESSASRRSFVKPRYEQDRDKGQRRYCDRDGRKGYGRHTRDEGREVEDGGQRRYVYGSRDHRRDLRSDGGRSRGYPQRNRQENRGQRSRSGIHSNDEGPGYRSRDYPQRNLQANRGQRSRSGVHCNDEGPGYGRNANSANLKHQSVQKRGEDEPITPQQEHAGQKSRGSTHPPVNRSGYGRKAESAKDPIQHIHQPAAAAKHPEPSAGIDFRVTQQSARTRQTHKIEK